MPMTFYVTATPSKDSAERIVLAMEQLGLPHMPAADLHVTTFYCKENTKDTTPDPLNYGLTVRITGCAILGSALALLFEPPAIMLNRFSQLTADGYKHSYSALLPHISIFYSDDAGRQPTADDIEKVNSRLRIMPLDVTLVGETVNQIREKEAPTPEPVVETPPPPPIPATNAAEVVANTPIPDPAEVKAEIDSTLGGGGSDTAKDGKSKRESFLKAFHTALSDNEAVVEAWGDTAKFKEVWIAFSKQLLSKMK